MRCFYVQSMAKRLTYSSMKPTRIRMCHALVMNYGLYKKMEIFVSRPNPSSALVSSLRPHQRAKPATKREMTQFHTDEYIDFLARITPTNMNSYVREQHKCMQPNAP